MIYKEYKTYYKVLIKSKTLFNKILNKTIGLMKLFNIKKLLIKKKNKNSYKESNKWYNYNKLKKKN